MKKTLETIKIEGITAPVIKCKANKDFTINELNIKAGDEIFLIRSQRHEGQYHVIKWNYERIAWQCCCYQGCKFHIHTKVVNDWVHQNRVASHKSPYVRQIPAAQPAVQEAKQPLTPCKADVVSQAEGVLAQMGMLRGQRTGGQLAACS